MELNACGYFAVAKELAAQHEEFVGLVEVAYLVVWITRVDDGEVCWVDFDAFVFAGS